MAAGDVTITVIGNLTDDPELRFTPSGAAVAKFRVASTPRLRAQPTVATVPLRCSSRGDVRFYDSRCHFACQM